MTVDDPAHAGRVQRGVDGFRRDVHDVHRLHRLFRFALHACAAGDRDPLVQRLPEEIALELRIADHRPELLVGDVTRAPGVAVRKQCPLAGDLDDDRVREQSSAGRQCEVMPEQRVAIAMHQQQSLPARGRACQRRNDRLHRRQRVVADPELEKVTEDHEFAVARRVFAHEAQEALRGARPRARQVEVGDEYRIRQRCNRRCDRQRRRRFLQ